MKRFFIGFLVINVYDVFCSETRFVNVKTLNFQMQESNINIKSGPHGNVYLIDKSIFDDKYKKKLFREGNAGLKKFDVDNIHDLLGTNASGVRSGNKVTGAMTMLMQRKDQGRFESASYYGNCIMLTRPFSNKLDFKKDIVRFYRSLAGPFGSGEKGYPDEIPKLYRDFERRSKIFSLDLRKLKEIIDAIQKVKIDAMVQCTLSACAKLSFQGNSIRLESIIADLDDSDKEIPTEKWMKELVSATDEMQGHLRKLNSTEYWQYLSDVDLETFEIVVSENIVLQKLQNTPKLHLFEKDNDGKQILGRELRSGGGYGPVTHSEQHFLRFLDEKLVNLIETEDGVDVEAIYSKFSSGILEMKELEDYNSTQLDSATIGSESRSSSDESKKENDFIPIGCFIHLFSTNEPCEYCSTSLLYEFYKSENENFASRLKIAMGTTQGKHEAFEKSFDPFVVIFVSYNKEISTDDPYLLRPQGTISGNLGRDPEDDELIDGLINLKKIIGFNEPFIPFMRSTCEDLICDHRGNIVFLSQLTHKK